MLSSVLGRRYNRKELTLAPEYVAVDSPLFSFLIAQFDILLTT